MSIEVGQVFAGRYLIRREIGRGGMGVVFEARDQTLDRLVAVKVLQTWLATPEFVQRFEREASVLAKMRSPHVLAIYDFGTTDDVVYLVTPLLPDGDLAHWLRTRGPLPRPQALRVVGQVAEALADAHDNGVIHRDVKPANVLLWQRRARLLPFLCDFGIAKDERHELTRTNVVIGSTSYMAPERHRGEEASRAADVYALGCLLWAALTGHAPYRGTDYEIMTGHVHGAPPALTPSDDVAVGINELLATVMAKDPARRTITADEVGERLARLASLDPTDPDLFPGGAPPSTTPLDPASAAALAAQGVEATPTPAPTAVRRPVGAPPQSPPDAAPVAAPPRGRRRLAALVAAAALVGTGVGVAVGISSSDEPAPDALGGDVSAATSSPRPTATSPASPPPPLGLAAVTPRPTYRSVTFGVTPADDPADRDLGIEARTRRGGSWQPVDGTSYRVDVAQGGDRACASFRVVDLTGAAEPGDPVTQCGRSQRRTVDLVELDVPCDRVAQCTWFDVRVTGFRPGTRPRAFIYDPDGSYFCTCVRDDFRPVVIDKNGRGVQSGVGDAPGEWFIEPTGGAPITLDVDGVRRSFFVD